MKCLKENKKNSSNKFAIRFKSCETKKSNDWKRNTMPKRKILTLILTRSLSTAKP